MDSRFFEQPILNSPYECPVRHWELDKQGQPTQKIIDERRSAEFIAPVPKPKKVKLEPSKLHCQSRTAVSYRMQTNNMTLIH